MSAAAAAVAMLTGSETGEIGRSETETTGGTETGTITGAVLIKMLC